MREPEIIKHDPSDVEPPPEDVPRHGTRGEQLGRFIEATEVARLEFESNLRDIAPLLTEMLGVSVVFKESDSVLAEASPRPESR